MSTIHVLDHPAVVSHSGLPHSTTDVIDAADGADASYIIVVVSVSVDSESSVATTVIVLDHSVSVTVLEYV